MEQENKKSDIFNKKVGNIERESKRLSEKVVTIVESKEKLKMSNGKDFKLPLIEIRVKHPDKEEIINISKIKILKDTKIITKTLWVVLDEAGDIQLGSAIDDLLKYMKLETLSELDGKAIDTVYDDKNFLCIKAY